MEQSIDRVGNEVNIWNQKRKDYLSLGKGTLKSDKKFLREELRYLDAVAAKYNNTLSPDEKLSMIYVNGRREDLARRHLGPLRKLWRRITGWNRQTNLSQRNEAAVNRNIRNIRLELKKLGFDAVAKQVEQNIRKGLPEFEVQLSYAISEQEKVSFKLNFMKSTTGDYVLDHYKVNLTNEQTRISSGERRINPIEGQFFSADQAIALLSKRSVALHHTDNVESIGIHNSRGHHLDRDEQHTDPSARRTVWYKLDLNDNLSPSGQLALKEYHSNYNFDILARMDELKFRDENKSLYPAVYAALHKGERVAIEMPRAEGFEKIFIEADPQRRDFKYFNAQQEEISKATALLGQDSNTNPIKTGMSEEQLKKELLELNFKDAEDPTKLNGIMQALYRNEEVKLDRYHAGAHLGTVFIKLDDTKTGLTRYSIAMDQQHSTVNSQEALAASNGIQLDKQAPENDVSKRVIELRKDFKPKYNNGRTKSLKN